MAARNNWISRAAVQLSQLLCLLLELDRCSYLNLVPPPWLLPACLPRLQHLGLLNDWVPVSAGPCIQPDGAAAGAAGTVTTPGANGSEGSSIVPLQPAAPEAESDVAAIESVLG